MAKHRFFVARKGSTPQNKDCNNPYKNLAYAIVLQACEDYEATLRLEADGYYATSDYKYAKEFLLSEEPEYLTGIPGRDMVKRIKAKVRKEIDRVYRR